jgi:transcriptional regulator with XRE-family HTH domain
MRRRPHPLVAQLKAARRRRGLTLDDVTDLCVLPKTTVSAWETGTRHPNLISLETYASALGQAIALAPIPTSKDHV